MLIVQVNGNDDDRYAINYERIKNTIPGTPTFIEYMQWKHFGYNRNKLLDFAYLIVKNKPIDYFLMMDADEEMVCSGDAISFGSDADVYDIEISDAMSFVRPLILSAKKNWVYYGSAHEYLHIPKDVTRRLFDDVKIKLEPKQNNNHILRNYSLLKKYPATDPFHKKRELFYLAQSCFDLGWYGESLFYIKQYTTDEAYKFDDELYQAMLISLRINIHFSETLKNIPLSPDVKTFCQTMIAKWPLRCEYYYYALKHFCDVKDHESMSWILSSLRNIPRDTFEKNYMFFRNDIFNYLLEIHQSVGHWMREEFNLAREFAHKVNLREKNLPELVFRTNYDNLFFYEKFDKMSDENLLQAFNIVCQELQKQEHDAFILETPYDYDGLGEQAIFATLVTAVKRKKIYKEILISDRCRFKTPGTEELLYKELAKVKGGSNTMPVHFFREFLNRRYRLEPLFAKMLGIEYDLEDFILPMPSMSYEPKSEVLFDGNSKSVKFTEYQKTLIRLQLAGMLPMGKSLQVAHFGDTNYVNADISTIQPKDIFEYASMICTTNKVIGLPSGGSILAALYSRSVTKSPVTVFRPKDLVEQTFMLPEMETIWVE